MLALVPILASSNATSGFVFSLLVILGAAAAVSVILPALSRFGRVELPAIPGYLIVGAIVGALGLATPETGSSSVQQISDLAIVLLMFTIGMHLDVESIRGGMIRIFTVGGIATVLISLVGWGIAMVFGLSAPAALVVAMALSMSSTAVVLGILNAKRELHRVHGRLCVGISLTQDLISVAVLGLLPPIAIWATGRVVGHAPELMEKATGLPKWAETLSSGLLALGGITLMLWFGRFLLPKLLKEASRGGNTEALLVISAAAALASAVLTNVLGFGTALGAFLAGFLLSATPFRHQLAGQLSPMRDLFMAVFFTAVGVQINLGATVANLWIIVLAAIALFVVKALITAGSCWVGGATAPVAALTGIMLAQAGEFSLVVLQQGNTQGIIDDKALSIVTALVVVSLIVTEPLTDHLRPHLAKLYRIRPAKWITTPALREAHERVGSGHASDAGAMVSLDANGAVIPAARPAKVIIAGFGVVGRNVAEHLAAYNMTYTVIEMNPRTVETQSKLGHVTVFGDVCNPDVLESAGLHDADAIILTIPDDDATLVACRLIRAKREDIFIAVRTTYLSQAIAATDLGANHVTIEEVVTAQDMATKLVTQLGKRLAKPTTPHL